MRTPCTLLWSGHCLQPPQPILAGIAGKQATGSQNVRTLRSEKLVVVVVVGTRLKGSDFESIKMSTTSSYRPPLSSRPGSRPPAPPCELVRRPRSRSTSSIRVSASPPPPGCICTRPYGTVFCKSCGWICNNSRVKTPCPVHSRTIYLMDIDMCPQCRAYPPVLTEFPRK